MFSEMFVTSALSNALLISRHELLNIVNKQLQ